MTQQSGHTSTSGPEVKDKQKRTKHGRGVARDGGIRNGITWRYPFSVQTLVKTKKLVVFGPNELETQQNEKARSLLQISRVMVLHHSMVSSQMVTPQKVSPWAAALSHAPLSPLATPLKHGYT